MKQLDLIVEALKQLGGKATYYDIYKRIELIIGKPLTYGQKAGIRKNIELHSSDSANYNGGKNIFYSVYGIGHGEWGLRE